MTTTDVYVDGFNLYYGAVKGTPYKWLDVRRMCELLFPKNRIQGTFIRALETSFFPSRSCPRSWVYRSAS